MDTNSDISGNFERSSLTLSSVGIQEVDKCEGSDTSVEDILFLNFPSADDVKVNFCTVPSTQFFFKILYSDKWLGIQLLL